jgi:outer membrane lipoprotein-sorting protein
MNNRIIPGLIALLLIAMLLIAGCSGKTSTTSPTTPSPTPSTTSPTDEATTTPSTTATTSDVTLGDILGRSAGIASLKYDMVITAAGNPTMTQAIWVKKNKMRTEVTQQGQTTVILMDNDTNTMYTYMPAENMAIEMSWDPTTKSAVDEAQSLSDYNPTIVGTETIDGKVCTVVQYTVEGQTVKMWLWQDHGLPIRVEATTAQGTTLMEYKNIQFVDIPDNMFTLPADVQIMQISGM